MTLYGEKIERLINKKVTGEIHTIDVFALTYTNTIPKKYNELFAIINLLGEKTSLKRPCLFQENMSALKLKKFI